MELNLAGKVAVVTGASRGIGAEIARELAREGCTVVLAARSGDLLAEVADGIAAAGGKATAHASDLRAPEAPAALVAATLAAHGRIDLLVNNAGTTQRGDFLALTDADWADGFALKFFAHMRLCRAAWPELKARRGSIVFIAGAGGRTPGAEFTIGGSVNAALLSFTKALADRGVADGVRVNTICPGLIRTDRLARRLKRAAEEHHLDPAAAERHMIEEARVTRVGETSDVAGLVAFVASPRGSYLHGALIDIDGGMTKTV